jgi:integrase
MQGHVRKRGSKWCIVVDTGRDEQGKRKQRWHSGFATKREAQTALTEILSRLQTGAYIEPSKLTVSTFLRQWLAAKASTIRPSTLASYRAELENHVMPRIGAIAVQNLAPASLTALYGELQRTGRRSGKGGLSARSVGYIAMIVRQALADGVRWGQLMRNVADFADPPRPGAPFRDLRTWTATEARSFLDAVAADRFYPAFLLAASTGMRRGEVLGMRWRDVDLDAARLSVSQSLVSVRYRLTFSEPKTARGRRSIALDPVTVAALRALRKRQLEERIALGGDWPPHDLLFTSHDGAPIHPDYLSELFHRRLKAAGLPRIRFHDLRHTWATLALANGVHARVVQERLGHANVATTLNIYSHVIPGLQEEAATRVAALIAGT